VHRREIVCQEPWVVFPGNLQGRYARESGAKGATLVTVEDGRIETVEHRDVDVVRWVVCDVDVSSARSADDSIDLARTCLAQVIEQAEGRTVAARLQLSGSTAAHSALCGDSEKWQSELRVMANDVGLGDLWIERIIFGTRSPIDFDGIACRDDALGQLVRSLRELRADEAALVQLLEELDDLPEKLRALRDEAGGGALTLNDPAQLRAALNDVEQLLVPYLLETLEDT
jgi:hypothetical protein